MQQKKIIDLPKHARSRLSKPELVERCESQVLEITKLKDELAKKDEKLQTQATERDKIKQEEVTKK